MQVGAPRRRDRHLDGSSDQLVPEAQRLAVVGQHAACDRLLDQIPTAGDDGSQQRGRDALPEHRRRVDDAGRTNPVDLAQEATSTAAPTRAMSPTATPANDVVPGEVLTSTLSNRR